MEYEEVEEVVMLVEYQLINALIEFNHLFFLELALQNKNHSILEFRKSEFVRKIVNYLIHENKFFASREQLEMALKESLKKIPYLFNGMMPYDDRFLVNFSARDALTYLNQKYPLDRDEDMLQFVHQFYQYYQLEKYFTNEERKNISLIPERKRVLNIYPQASLKKYILCRGSHYNDLITWELCTDGEIIEIPSKIEIPSYYMCLNPSEDDSLMNIKLQAFHQVMVKNFSYVLYQGKMLAESDEYLNRSLYLNENLDVSFLKELSSPSLEFGKSIQSEVPNAYQKKLILPTQGQKKLSV